MPDFLGVWLPLWICTWIAAVVQYVSHRNHGFVTVITFLVAEFGALVIWAFYGMVLYPRYFTPFRQLPTPPGRTLRYGNRKQFFPEYAWDDVRNAAETVPNNGLMRFYDALSKEALVVTKTEAIKEMLTLKPDDFGHPKNVQYLMHRLTGSRFSFLSPHGHKAFRKHLRPAFTVAHIRSIMPTIWGRSDHMTRLIRRELQANPDPHHTVDIRDYLRRTMWDIFGLIVLGHDFQTLDKPAAGTRDKLVGILGRMNGRLVQWANFIMTYVDVRPLLKVLSPLLMKSPTGKALEQIRNSVTQAVGRKETEFRADTAKRGSNEQREGEGEGSGRDITHISLKSGVFPSEELIDNAMLFLTAGPNSTAAAVEWAIYEMCRRPEIQARLRDEINECLDPAQLNGTSGLSGAALLRNLQSLPYLSAVCNEVIRYYPFVPLSPRVAERDTSLLGVPIPRGATLLTPVEVFNRSKELWGHDAEEFNPDRWMGVGRETNGGAANAYAFMSFGAGPGTCIGKDYARAMMACLVAALVREFEIEVVNLETAGRLLPAPFKKSLEGMQVRLRALHHS